MFVLLLDLFEPKLGIEVALGVDPRSDELAQERADEGLLSKIEFRIDVAAGRQVENDGLDLLLGDLRILAQLDHEPNLSAGGSEVVEQRATSGRPT